jgi:hypothetical protein
MEILGSHGSTTGTIPEGPVRPLIVRKDYRLVTLFQRPNFYPADSPPEPPKLSFTEPHRRLP